MFSTKFSVVYTKVIIWNTIPLQVWSSQLSSVHWYTCNHKRPLRNIPGSAKTPKMSRKTVVLGLFEGYFGWKLLVWAAITRGLAQIHLCPGDFLGTYVSDHILNSKRWRRAGVRANVLQWREVCPARDGPRVGEVSYKSRVEGSTCNHRSRSIKLRHVYTKQIASTRTPGIGPSVCALRGVLPLVCGRQAFVRSGGSTHRHPSGWPTAPADHYRIHRFQYTMNGFIASNVQSITIQCKIHHC